MFLDAAPSFGAAATGLALGAVIFLVAIAVAIIAFKILKRSLKMAFRAVIIVMILIIAALASVGVFVYKIANAPKTQKPSPTQRQK